jgi:tetratricopeptide (TPR) repeat protein
MAKQRRSPPPKPSKASELTGTRPPHPTPAAAPSAPQRRTTYFEAVALYERGVEALQRHEFDAAMTLLESVLRQYPEEKELHERVQLYLNVCRRQATPRASSPQTLEERLYAATLAINGGKYDDALVNLRLVRDEDPDNDYALYMLAVAHAQRGELAQAIAMLERAISLNPENRGLAKNDLDLEPLRDDDSFRTALETPSLSRPVDRPRPIRTKSTR